MKTRFLPAVAATLITAGALAAPSLAQDTAPSDSGTTATQSENAPTDEEREARQAEREANKAEREGRYNELLAGELGVTVDELVAARETVKETIKAEMRVELEAKLSAKVEAGEITQEKMDEILAAFDAGERPNKGRKGNNGRGPGADGNNGRGPSGQDA